MNIGPHLLDVPKDAQKLRLDRELLSNDRPVLYFGPGFEFDTRSSFLPVSLTPGVCLAIALKWE